MILQGALAESCVFRSQHSTCYDGSPQATVQPRMLTEQSSGGLKAPMFRASKLTFLLKDSLACGPWDLGSLTGTVLVVPGPILSTRQMCQEGSNVAGRFSLAMHRIWTALKYISGAHDATTGGAYKNEQVSSRISNS